MSLRVKLGILAAGLMLSGCMQAATYEAANTANFKPRTSYRQILVMARPVRRRRLWADGQVWR